MFSLTSIKNFLKLNLVDSIEGLLSLFKLIYLHLLDSRIKIVSSKKTMVTER
jgi:hypothetical protein